MGAESLPDLRYVHLNLMGGVAREPIGPERFNQGLDRHHSVPVQEEAGEKLSLLRPPKEDLSGPLPDLEGADGPRTSCSRSLASPVKATDVHPYPEGSCPLKSVIDQTTTIPLAPGARLPGMTQHFRLIAEEPVRTIVLDGLSLGMWPGGCPSPIPRPARYRPQPRSATGGGRGLRSRRGVISEPTRWTEERDPGNRKEQQR